MELWHVLLQLLTALGAALALGLIFERFGQSAILGYLAAGVLLGPGGLNLVKSTAALAALSELGVALLLFSIGLEFSWNRLRRFGAVAFGGGVLQVILTIAIAAGLLVLIGVSGNVALAVGAMVALSSTATVLRILTDRAELDAAHGRTAIGILLLQDIALVPLVVLVTILGGGGTSAGAFLATARSIAVGGGFVLLAYLVLNFALPRLLHTASAAKSRELGILLAMVTCLTAALAAHSLALSPALGAFVAGMLLAESPFATQVRADVSGLRTLFLTIFFVAAGTLAEVGFVTANLGQFILAVAAVLVLKVAVLGAVLRGLGVPTRHALATGICLAQVGEFSFVLAEIARGRLLSDDAFSLMVAATVATLFLTPYLVGAAPAIAAWSARHLEKKTHRPASASARGSHKGPEGHVVVVGYGPAGAGVAEALLTAGITPVVVDLNPRTAQATRRIGVEAVVGDARHEEVLRHAHVEAARAVVVTLPDYRAAELVLRLARILNPAALLIARARYHIFAPSLSAAGAQALVDEEHHVGRLLGDLTLQELGGGGRRPTDSG